MPTSQNNISAANNVRGYGNLRNDNLKFDPKKVAQVGKLSDEIEYGQNDPGWTKPRSIFNAISEIQRFHVIESKTEIPREYFTIEQVLDFFKIGFYGGIIESLLFTLLTVALQIAYPTFQEYFFHKSTGWLYELFFMLLTYLPVLVVTSLMLWLSRYYQGTFTKRAIYSLVNGRCASFLVKAAVIYFAFRTIQEVFAKEYETAQMFLGFIFNMLIRPFAPTLTDLDGFMAYYYEKISPVLMGYAWQVVIVMIASALVPYVTIYRKAFLDQVRQEEIKEELKDY